MSADNTPADRPERGPEEQAGSAQPDSADSPPARSSERASHPESPEARAEEADRMRDRVRQRRESEADLARDTGTKDVDPRPSGSSEPDPGRPPEGGRTIASGTASVRGGGGAGREGPAQRSHPVITGTAAARLLGEEKGEPVTSVGAQDPGGGTDRTERPDQSGQRGQRGQRGQGIDAPTSHIDRSNVSEDRMPDLGTVQHPKQATATPPAQDHDQHPQPRVTVGARRSRGPLRAAMQLRSIDPWSALKTSLLLSVAMFLVWMVAVAIIYIVLDGMGVWERLNTGVSDIVSDQNDAGTLIGPGQIFGVAAILGVINIVLFTALSTLGAFIYNLASDMVGGVEVTLADRD